ncbi:ATPase BadF/BadG/BcrA/BcrD type OS=Tsukamurella paurometabola (strain ATCC 8368 / DSM / CCUG 35730 / CIP 100753 / JCM 10117 / KCTC 9821 / NBRC 16120 / NCIMB 702349 / NCTC 13040) OX=521096 GN=Tpau_2047 PE=4 SV=1 [Tsukamurella paurometabola]|uniref:ATPase BadF/BadG/BcrA/BcrD type n=1 Tax=Tsukamurella paurometabola (strain ATCC 8368 / DSM 20162 / CCUG 35730 / CIP 100753 / JCM 10117 / KCTC 9821 / NBRC 16120 / NCIMB 702349 / NCTC 13040) TaxID=521096 RepID=D5UNU1_TSUPD|nr:BadF/BadG/BcrA/BcrD ATPase family protein [Tsukamurella paurometabola]ADG78659.1 ATPase BadF/BadG/BcrA/BcrD type [Tsukamurella paurometabola DSM 20162]SUP32611.1 BadF/BadG/BcrA/BcrD ATPase family [Tsukamurella paurometabola]
MSGTVIGLDIGGSKTHAVRAENGVVVAEALAGSANISSVGPVEAGRQLDIALTRLGVGDVAAVCAGAAGVETPAGAAALTRLLADRVPSARVRVVHDSQLILAAAGVRDGIAVISGTGAVAWGRAGERHARAGGWGYLLGDEGSGYWVAKEAVRRTLDRIDREEPADHLGQQLAADCGLQDPDELLDHFYAQTERRYWAGRARVVFELAQSGDVASTEIIDHAALALTDIAMSVAERIGSAGPVILAGGLAVHQPALQRRVRHHLGLRGVADVRVLTVDPVRGAIELAQRELDRSGATA